MKNMASFEIHTKKYEMFKKDGNNPDVSEPTRIEALFEACFHLIEAVAAMNRVHINKHQLLRQILEENEQIFGHDTKDIWESFQELENQIRPGQIYGGKINGEQLKRSQELMEIIEFCCNKVLRKMEK